MEIVHITFEKLTGLNGTFEGVFICEEKLDPKMPLMLDAFLLSKMEFVFLQDGRYVYMKLANWRESINYLGHFMYGGLLLIKEWSYGRGGGIKITNQNPN